MPSSISRRTFLQSVAVASAGSALPSFRIRLAFGATSSDSPNFLLEFGYGDVSLDSPIHEEQLRQTHAVLMGLDDDALMKPFRAMVGQSAVPWTAVGDQGYTTYL